MRKAELLQRRRGRTADTHSGPQTCYTWGKATSEGAKRWTG